MSKQRSCKKKAKSKERVNNMSSMGGGITTGGSSVMKHGAIILGSGRRATQLQRAMKDGYGGLQIMLCGAGHSEWEEQT